MLGPKSAMANRGRSGKSASWRRERGVIEHASNSRIATKPGKQRHPDILSDCHHTNSSPLWRPLPRSGMFAKVVAVARARFRSRDARILKRSGVAPGGTGTMPAGSSGAVAIGKLRHHAYETHVFG